MATEQPEPGEAGLFVRRMDELHVPITLDVNGLIARGRRARRRRRSLLAVAGCSGALIAGGVWLTLQGGPAPTPEPANHVVTVPATSAPGPSPSGGATP